MGKIFSKLVKCYKLKFHRDLTTKQFLFATNQLFNEKTSLSTFFVSKINITFLFTDKHANKLASYANVQWFVRGS